MWEQDVKRRHVLGLTSLPLLAISGGWWWGAGHPEIDGAESVDAVLELLDLLQREPRTMRTGWPLAYVCEHCAQSIEFSIDGYPKSRSSLFQHTLGALAFGVFDRRGRMRHDLQEPIPGAPPLQSTDTPAAIARLAAALQRFEGASSFKPHFAYGLLDQASYRRAHLMHIAEHFTLLG